MNSSNQKEVFCIYFRKYFTKKFFYVIIYTTNLYYYIERADISIVTARKGYCMKKFSLTIARQYGSGGREIGLVAADILGVKAYGRELINLAAQKSGMSEDILHIADEKHPSSLLYTLAMGSTAFGIPNIRYDIPINDKLFSVQSDIIRKTADEESAVFIGRCADYVLSENYPVFRVFIYAPIEKRIKRISERNAISESEARSLIEKTDKRRANYYNFYTGQKWGRYENYDLLIDSTIMGIEGTAQLIADAAKIKFKD